MPQATLKINIRRKTPEKSNIRKTTVSCLRFTKKTRMTLKICGINRKPAIIKSAFK